MLGGSWRWWGGSLEELKRFCVCGRQNNFLRCPSRNYWNLSICCLTHGTKDFADGESLLNYSGEPSVITIALKSGRERQVVESKENVIKKKKIKVRDVTYWL